MTERVAPQEASPLPPIEQQEWRGEFWRAASASSNKELADGGVRAWTEDVIEVDGEHGYFALCDGMGGKLGGQQAASIVAQTIKGEPTYAELRDTSEEGFFPRQFAAAQGEILRERTGELARMDTTATVMYIGELEGGERYAVLGHVGDCRAYFVYPTGEVVPLTEDDDWLNSQEAYNELFKGKSPAEVAIQRAEIRRELDEATSVDQLSPAALGLYVKRNQTQGVASAHMKPHITAVRFPPGCRIVLMSDGVYENIRPEKIGGILSMNSVLSPQEQSAALVREAQEGVSSQPTLTTKMDDKKVLIVEST